MNSITKKLVRDYVYHMTSLEDVKDISKEAELEFRDALTKSHENALQALSPKEGQAPPKKVDDIEPVKFDDKSFKKLFRKLAVKCHPDKLNDSYSEREKEFLSGCYENITLANETYNWGLLLKVALELEVEVQDLEQSQIDNIKENIEKLKEKIHKYEESMAYKWYSLTDTSAREQYLQSCANIFIKSLGEG